MGYQLIEHIEVGAGGAASMEFTGIPQDGVDLALLFSVRVVGAGSGFKDYSLHLNGETTGTNYAYKQVLGNGSTAPPNSYSGPEARFTMEVNDSGSEANTFSNSSVYFSNYASSAFKSVSIDSIGETNATSTRQEITAGVWNNTAAITSITLKHSSNTAQYSTASLYKITAD
jgi:hypothetical protein